MSLDPALAAHAAAAAGDAIVTLDASARTMSWNRAAERLLQPGGRHGARARPDHPGRVPGAPRRRFHASMDSGHLPHGGAVARVEALTASRGRLALGLSLSLLADEGGQPPGVAGVLRPLADAAVEFVTPQEASA